MAILDLNADITPADSANIAENEDSGTSVSSVVNSEEAQFNIRDKDSSNNSSCAFIFDILKKESNGIEDAEKSKKENTSAEIVTRTLFPVNGDKGGIESDFKSGLSGKPHWLNSSFADPELRILQQKQPQIRKNRRGPRSRSSQYRGVTFYRRTGRWESHIWDCGKQVYLGGFDTAHAAARAYDWAAIKFRGVEADINFSLSDYEEDLKQMRSLSKEEFVHLLRRQSTGIPRGNSKHRSVALQKCGQWEAQVRHFLDKKVHDRPFIKPDGIEGATSFQPNNYQREIFVDPIRGSCHNLELSLGISPPSKELKRNIAAGDFSFRSAAYELPNRGGAMVDSSGGAMIRGQAIYGLAMAPKYDQILSGLYPNYIQNHEDKASEKRLDAVSLPRLSNLAWQLHSNGSIISPVPVLSNAASSGFALASSNTAQSAPPAINPHNNSVYNFCFN